MSCAFVLMDVRGIEVRMGHENGEAHRIKRQFTDAEMSMVQQVLSAPTLVVETGTRRGTCFYSEPMPAESPYATHRLQVIVHDRVDTHGVTRGTVATFWFTDEVEAGEVTYGSR